MRAGNMRRVKITVGREDGKEMNWWRWIVFALLAPVWFIWLIVAVSYYFIAGKDAFEHDLNIEESNTD